MPAVLRKEEDALVLDLSGCRGVEFQDTKARVQSIPGRRFDWDRKVWLLPLESSVAERVLSSIRPEASDELVEWVREARIQEQQELTTALPDDADLLLPWARTPAPWHPSHITGLLQHQRPVVDLIARNRRVIVADDMGLGKSAEVIAGVEETVLRDSNFPGGPRLVLCPASVMGSWEKELKLWLGPDGAYQLVDAVTAKKRQDQLSGVKGTDAWVVANWEQIRATKVQKKVKRRNGQVTTKTVEQLKQPLFAGMGWAAVVGDEAHRAKNRKAQVSRGLYKVRAENGLMIAATGTPIMNSPDELWSILHWLWPDQYTSYWRFYEQYVDYWEDHFNRRIVTGVKNPDALKFELSGRLVRRTQGQVLDLPGKIRIPVPVKLNPKQRKLYDEAEKAMWLEVTQAAADGDSAASKFLAAAREGQPLAELYKLPNGAARMVRLRQIIETPANLGADDDSAILDACVDKVLDSRPHPWVVFCAFKPTVGCLVDRFNRAGLKAKPFHGGVAPSDRSKLAAAFQAGEIDVLVGTIDAMYQGITLTAGNHQFWCSRDWTPAKNEQGEDRQNRIGQDSRVLVFIAEAAETVATDTVRPTNQRKERIVRAVIPTDEIKEAS